jgi:hypothetical protein
MDRNRVRTTTVSEIAERVKMWKPHLRAEGISGAIQALAYRGWINHRFITEVVLPVSPQ